MKEVQSQLPEQSAVAIEKRKEEEREAEKQDYGRTDGPQVSVTLCPNNESDSEDTTIRMGNNDSDHDWTPLNDQDSDNDDLVNARRGIEGVHITTSDGEGLPAVADTAEEKQIVVTPSAVVDSAKEKCFEDTSAAVAVADSAKTNCVEDTSAAVAIDRKDDGPTAVPEKK